jgi:hypothetical protein
LTSEFVASEAVVPETAFEPARVRVLYRCAQCGHQWKSRPVRIAPKKDPPCPNSNCVELALLRQTAREVENLKRMLNEQRAPAQVGAKTIVKVIDYTAKAAMEDYQLTDLKDSIREGESMAPKLPPSQQALADNYFGGQKDVMVKDVMTGQTRSVLAASLNRAGKKAMAGAYRNMAVPPNAVIPESMRGQPPLRMVRREDFRR